MNIFYNSTIGRGLKVVSTNKGNGLEPIQTKKGKGCNKKCNNSQFKTRGLRILNQYFLIIYYG